QSRLEALRKALAERDETAGLVTATTGAKVVTRDQHEKARAALTRAEEIMATAEADLKAAETEQHRAERQQASRDGALRRSELVQRIADAEAIRKVMEEAQASASVGPDQTALRSLESLSGALVTARATRDAMATQVAVR